MADQTVTVGAQMTAMVPMVATLGLRFISVTEDQATVELPDDAPWRNHVGGPHVGAMFTLAETATGALLLANMADLLPVVTPLARTAEMQLLALARGDVTATARFSVGSGAELRRQIEAGERPACTIEVQLSAEGRQTSAVQVDWAFVPTPAPDA